MARIVVMDDSKFQRKVLERIVTGDGHEVIEAADGREGLFKIATYWPDCILVDLVMPKVDGMEVLEALQAQQLDIPIIVITADIQELTQQRCKELGAAGFINKPIKAEQVLPVLRDILGSKEK